MLAFPEALTLSLFNDRGFWSTWLPRYLSLSLCHLVLLFRQFCSFSCTECLLSALNVANFNAVKEGGPLMMNVVGNVKQVVMIILSVFMFGNKMTFMGILGSVICILGSMWYTYGRSGEWE